MIADFNHDGHNDIGFTGDNYFNVDLGPTFSGHDRPLNATINTSYSVVADFNKDGWPDIVFTSPYGVSRLYNVPVPTVTPAGFIHFSNAGSQKVTVKNTTTTAQSLSAAFESGTKSTPDSPSPPTPAARWPLEPHVPLPSATTARRALAQSSTSARTGNSSESSISMRHSQCLTGPKEAART